MSKHAFRAAPKVRPTPPTDHDAEPAPVPTEAEARVRLADYRGSVDRMTQAEFDALVAIAGPAEDEMAGH